MGQAHGILRNVVPLFSSDKPEIPPDKPVVSLELSQGFFRKVGARLFGQS